MRRIKKWLAALRVARRLQASGLVSREEAEMIRFVLGTI